MEDDSNRSTAPVVLRYTKVAKDGGTEEKSGKLMVAGIWTQTPE
jgi:hypothetical protein